MKTTIQSLWKDKANQSLLGLALVALAVQLISSTTYGYFRDEFYYIAASKHLDFGYVDFPPFIALLTAFIRATLGESLLALHFFPALNGAVLVFMTGLMARQLGASKTGQVLAALTTLVTPQFLGVNSRLTMDPFDTLAWSLALYALIIIFKYDRPKDWLWFGLAAGISLTIKISMLYVGLALVIGLALTSARKHFRNPWLYVGGGIALAFLLPYVIWNAIHGWPTVEFFGSYGEKVYKASPLEFLLQQVLIMHPVTLPLWLAGLVYLFSKDGRTYRPLGWMYIVLLAIFMLQGAKNYFLAPYYPLLFAAGATGIEQGMLAGRLNWLKSRAYVVALVVFGLLTAPMAIPILPFKAHLAYMRLMGGTNAPSEKYDSGVFPQHFADRFGWQELAANVANIYHRLPPEDQSRACIFTVNYGEAGALEFYSSEYNLPPVVSGHNNYYIWGPGKCTGEVIIFIGQVDRADLEQVFTEVQPVGVTDCQYCMTYENNLTIFLARGIKIPLQQLWPKVKLIG